MSLLRKLAQTNAANIQGSPGSPSPRPTSSNGTQTPVTPRTRVSYVNSPSATPSISSSIPFDWEAARSMRPPPYGTPFSGKRKTRMSTVGTGMATPKRVIRKKGFTERWASNRTGMHSICLTESQDLRDTLTNYVRTIALSPQRTPTRSQDERVAGWRLDAPAPFLCPCRPSACDV